MSLKPDELARAGIATTPATAARRAPESTGYAIILNREPIAQAVAEVSSALAVARQSRAALARAHSLAGTPGAMPIESQQNAQRQVAVDQSALSLAEQRISATYGQNAPWKNNYNNRELLAIANAETKLARVTFPLGALGSTFPTTLRFMPIGDYQSGRSFESTAVWSAPADANLPGQSFFALLKGTEVSEGEHLLARAAIGPPEAGVVVPFSAVVISSGRYWCYVEKKPGLFERVAIDSSMPTDEGYFIKGPIVAGANLVTRSAGELLARETNPNTAAD